MEWLLYVVAACFFVLSAACVVLVVLQLPGGWIMLALAAVIEWLDELYLPAERQPTFPMWLLIVSLGLLLLGELVEFVAAAEGARRGGRNPSLAVGLSPFYILQSGRENLATFSRIQERWCEGTFECEAHLRALQGGASAGRDARHLQAQPQAQAAAGLTWRVLLA